MMLNFSVAELSLLLKALRRYESRKQSEKRAGGNKNQCDREAMEAAKIIKRIEELK